MAKSSRPTTKIKIFKTKKSYAAIRTKENKCIQFDKTDIPLSTLLENYNRLSDVMNRIKESIFDISLKCGPNYAMKMGNLFHERKISSKICSGFVENNTLMSRKSLHRELKDGDNFGWYKVRGGLVKLPKEVAGAYPFLSFSARIVPQKPLHPEVEAIFKSVYRHWDGKKWVEPTRNFSSLKKVKEFYVKRGFEWPELPQHDMCLQPPLVVNPSPVLRHSVYNHPNYVKYIKRVVLLQKAISRTSRRLRGVFRHIPARVVYPDLERLGYSHKYLKYTRDIPTLHNKVLRVLSQPKTSKRIEKLSSRLKALLDRRLAIWRLQRVRETLFRGLVDLNVQRNSVYHRLQALSSESIPTHQTLINKSAAKFIIKKLDKNDQVLKKSSNLSAKTVSSKGGAKTHPRPLDHRLDASIHPDRLRGLLFHTHNYNQQRDAFLGRLKPEKADHKVLTPEQYLNKLKEEHVKASKLSEKYVRKK